MSGQAKSRFFEVLILNNNKKKKIMKFNLLQQSN